MTNLTNLGGVFVLLFGMSIECRAFLLWPDKISSSWAASEIQVDGDDSKWSGVREAHEPQLEIRAINDSSHLYLRLCADGQDGRSLLSGAYRQDVTLWFLGADGKSRAWGIRLPFSRLGPVTAPMLRSETSGMPDVEPELVLPQQWKASAATLPQDIQIRSGYSGKDPVVEMGIPLERLKPKDGKFILFNLVSSEVSGDIQRQLQARGAGPPRESSAKADSSGKGWQGRGFSSGGWGGIQAPGSGQIGEHRRLESSQPQEVTFPDPLKLRLSIRLAPKPGAL